MKVILFLLILNLSLLARDTLRVASYNILNYNGYDRTLYFNTITQAIDADIIIVQEMIY